MLHCIHLLNASYSSTYCTNKYDHFHGNPCGIWHANFRSVAHCIGKRERVGGLLKPFENWARGMNSYHWAQKGVNWFSAQWLTGAAFTTLSSRRMKYIPGCSFYLEYLHSQPLHSEAEAGLGYPPFYPLSKCADRGTCPCLLIPRRGGLWFSCFHWQMPKVPLSDLDHKVREEHTGKPTMKYMCQYNSHSEFTVIAMSTKQLGNWVFGKVEVRLALATWQMFPSLRTIALWHQPAFPPTLSPYL